MIRIVTSAALSPQSQAFSSTCIPLCIFRAASSTICPRRRTRPTPVPTTMADTKGVMFSSFPTMFIPMHMAQPGKDHLQPVLELPGQVSSSRRSDKSPDGNSRRIYENPDRQYHCVLPSLFSLLFGSLNISSRDQRGSCRRRRSLLRSRVKRSEFVHLVVAALTVQIGQRIFHNLHTGFCRASSVLPPRWGVALKLRSVSSLVVRG